MEKLHYSIVINAPREKVWDVMLNEKTYRKWTTAFHPESHYVGSWDQGSEIRFLAPGDNGESSGMISRIRENRPHEYISIEHLGIIENGKEDTTSDAAKKLNGAQENYTFKDLDGKTELLVDMDSSEEYVKMFNETWPKALNNLKSLVEG